MSAHAADFVPLDERSDRLLQVLRDTPPVAAGDDTLTLPGINLQTRQCAAYPYSESEDTAAASAVLIDDLARGLETGLRCLSGQGPAGRLHPYHEYQAHRLVSLLENGRAKTFQCVADRMFATAVATSPDGTSVGDPLYGILRQVEFPGVVLDTYRLGGVLSRRLDDRVYRAFFHLADDQIVEHRNGQPLRPANLHRYANRPALLFHETIHWLGHEHSAIYPDMAHLYETCCFGGSDYIDDPTRNAAHQATGKEVLVRILQDDDLWSQSYMPYRQMRIWHHKGYDRLKSAMRRDYAS